LQIAIAVAGERQVIFVIGEASRRCLVAHGQCIEQLGAGEPYLPLGSSTC